MTGAADDALVALAQEIVADQAALSEDVRAATPKAWGKLAALGVVEYRRRFGRAPSEGERRALWAELWRATHTTVR